jgi:hypothetical protein
MKKPLLVRYVMVALFTSTCWLAHAQSSWSVGLTGGASIFPSISFVGDQGEFANKRSSEINQTQAASPLFGVVAEHSFNSFFLNFGLSSTQVRMDGSNNYWYRQYITFQPFTISAYSTNFSTSFGIKLGKGKLKLRTALGINLESIHNLKIEAGTGFERLLIMSGSGGYMESPIQATRLPEDGVNFRVVRYSPSFLFRIGPEFKINNFRVALEGTVLHRLTLVEDYDTPDNKQGLTYFQAQATVYYTLFSKPKVSQPKAQ